jgi:hypothetical protein
MYIYQFKLVCRCQNDQTVNIYDVEIQSQEMIEVEEFSKFQDKIYDDVLFQEDVFELLKELYQNVQIVGYHNGVKVITK